jgi:hypothetical protein
MQALAFDGEWNLKALPFTLRVVFFLPLAEATLA